MNAKDIMTSKVITVTSGTLVSEIARLLFERRISALPVVDGERLAGIVDGVRRPAGSGTNDAASPCVKVNAADFANLSLLGLPASLQRKLERAVLVPTDDVPPDVVTMLSRVAVTDAATGRRREIAVVYPAEADAAAGRVSVLDELGTALFAATVGDTIRYEAIDGPCELRVEEILYQPERWMRKNLVVRE